MKKGPVQNIVLAFFTTLAFLLCGCSTMEKFCQRTGTLSDASIEISAIHRGLEGEDDVLSSRQIIVEANEIFQNNRGGLRVRGSTPVLIKNCRVYGNGRSGLRLERHADVLILYSRIYENKTSGIDVVDAKRIGIRRSELFRNLTAGIRIRDEIGAILTKVQLIDSRMFLNGQAGLFVSPNPGSKVVVDVSGCEIFQNRKSAVRIEGSTILTARRNTIFSNGSAGLFAISHDDFFPVIDVFENKIYFNSRAGILIQGGVTGSIGISNNWIYNNYESGIVCGIGDEYHTKYSSLGIYHNTIVANGSDFEGAGIRIDNNGTMDIQNNIIAYNLRAAIMTYHCRDASHNLLFANGQTPDYRPSRDYSFLIRRLQYGGCPAKGSGDILADPLFLDPDRYDFTLSDRSPAKGMASRLEIPYFAGFRNRDLGCLLVPGVNSHGGNR